MNAALDSYFPDMKFPQTFLNAILKHGRRLVKSCSVIHNLSRCIFILNLVYRNTNLNLSCDSDYIYSILISSGESASFVLRCCSYSMHATVVGYLKI